MRHTLALIAVLSTLLPSVALAQQPRVLVLRFAGWNADDAREAVTSALMTEVQLVAEDTAIAAAEDLGVDVGSSEGFAALVQHLEIDLVVAGEIEGRGARATTTIMVVDAAGDELARRSGPSPSGAARLGEVGATAVLAIQDAQAEIGRRANPQPEPPVAPQPVVPVQPREPEPEEPDAIGWAQKQLLFLAGIRLRTVGTYVADENGLEHFFEADAYPEIDLELVFRPWFAAEEAEMRGLMFGVQGAFSAGIAYYGPDGVARGMTSYRFLIELAYGVMIEDVVEIIAALGFGLDGVSLDVADAFPSTLYSFLRPAVTGRFRIVPDFLIAEAGIGARIGLDGGPLNAAYGPSLVYGGLDVFVGVTGSIPEGFAWSARFGYVYHALDFSGAMGTYANGDSGIDEAIEGRFLVGWTI